MLSLISPAKKLEFKVENIPAKASLPLFLNDTEELLQICKNLTKSDLKNLMSISDALAELNISRFKNFDINHTEQNSKPALYAFKGDVYSKIEVSKYQATDLNFAQDHISILSGLYGILRPLDYIQPYRLEMGTSLHTKRGEDLYDFWGSKIADYINDALAKHKNPYLINLASSEYFKAVKSTNIKFPIINIQFKENKDGQFQIIGLLAKRARGMMVDFIIKNKIDNPQPLKDFNMENYSFSASHSDNNNFVFIR